MSIEEAIEKGLVKFVNKNEELPEFKGYLE
jgi:hypothetical protein